MSIRRQGSSAFAGLLLALVATADCAHLRAPYSSDSPVVAPEGVRLALRGQRCAQSYDVDQNSTDQLVEEMLSVEIHNPTTALLTIRPEEFRLRTASGAALQTLARRGSTPVAVGPGETGVVELRFMASGMF